MDIPITKKYKYIRKAAIIMKQNEITIRKWNLADLPSLIQIWNEVVEGGRAFPQLRYAESGNRSFLLFFPIYGRRRNSRRNDRRPVHSSSQQHRTCRPYRQCKLCGKFKMPRASYRRAACQRLPGTGKAAGLPDFAVQRCSCLEYSCFSSVSAAWISGSWYHSRRFQKHRWRI